MPGRNKVYLSVFTVLLLCFTNFVRSGIIVDKSFLPRFIALSVLLLITWILQLRKSGFSEITYFVGAFVLYYLWNLLSFLWAIVPSEAIMQAQLIFLPLVLFLVISSFTNRNKDFESIFIKTQLVALLFAFGLAFYRMMSLEFFNPYQIISVSANNNLFSGYLLISMPFVLTGYSILKGFWKYLSVLVLTVSVFFIVIVQSRAAYMGLFLALLVAGILS